MKTTSEKQREWFERYQDSACIDRERGKAMSAAIHTKYIGPTLRHGGRIKAFCRGENRPGFTLTADYPHDLHHDEKHASVAKALATRLNWRGLWIVGGNFDGSIVCACVPGSFSRAWVDKYIPGKENADWFFIEEETGK